LEELFKQKENAAIFLSILAILISVNVQVGKFGLKRLSDYFQKREAESEKTIELYEIHTRNIIEKLDQLRNSQIEGHPGLIHTWIYTFQHFILLKDLLYHLYTDKRELFDLLEIALKSHEIMNKPFNSRIGEFVRSIIAGGDHLKGSCN